MPDHPPLKILAPGAPLVTQEAKNGLRMGSEPPVPLCYAATFLAMAWPCFQNRVYLKRCVVGHLWWRIITSLQKFSRLSFYQQLIC